jgi:3-methylcrotonyl-CoA carboxylase alpha subunit
VTNLAFLGALAEHDGFADGEVDTGLIARDLEALTRAPTVAAAHLAQAALALGDPGKGPGTGFALWGTLRRTLVLRRDGEDLPVVLCFDGPDKLRIETPLGAVTATRADAWRLDGQPGFATHTAAGSVTVFDGYGLHFEVADPLHRQSDTGAGAGLTLAPMPGRVVSVQVKAGQQVKAGDRLAVLEAMKMEHNLTAARDGQVAEVLVTQGDQVEAGAALVRLETEEEPA